MKPKSKGRPRFEQEEQKKRCVTLSDRLVKKGREIGNGNLSEGIRLAIEKYK
jgi:hypothetical protein